MFNQFLSSTYSSILSYRKLFMYNGSGNSCEKNLCNNIFFSARILNAHKINCKLWFDVLITLTHSIGADWYMYFIILWNFFYHSTLKYSYIRLLKSKYIYYLWMWFAKVTRDFNAAIMIQNLGVNRFVSF